MATTTTTQPTATAAQQERIGELYESRAVPETKKRDPANLTERSAKRWIGLLEAYPLKEETTQGIGGRSANGAKPRGRRKGTGTRVTDEELAARQQAEAKAAKGGTRTRSARPKAQAQPAGSEAKAKHAKVERKPVDAKLAQRVVTMRARLDGKGKPTSWAKIAYSLKLVPEGAPKAQAGDAARRAYRQIKGENAPTGPSDY
jgi:hypothetical protein